MQLILWRHAEAEEFNPLLSIFKDSERQLTPKGHAQAEKTAFWIKQHLQSPLRVIASPAQRTQQTASYLQCAVETEPRIGVSKDPENFFEVITEYAQVFGDKENTLILVSHQPMLGMVAAHLMTGQWLTWRMKKGQLWWFSLPRGDKKQARLDAVMAPEWIVS